MATITSLVEEGAFHKGPKDIINTNFTNVNAQLASHATALGFFQYARVTLTANEIKALRATPKTLVAAPGAGYALVFHGAVLQLDATATGFTETADNLAVKYTNGSGVAVSETIEMTGFIDQTADMATRAVPVKDAIVAKTGCANAALVLHNIGDGEIATGTGTMTIDVFYGVVPTV